MTATTIPAVRGRCNGCDMGTFQPIREENGWIGWQATSDDGKLLGILDVDGNFAAPYDGPWRTWGLCEETPAHTRALEIAAQPWRDFPIEWTR